MFCYGFFYGKTVVMFHYPVEKDETTFSLTKECKTGEKKG